MSATLEERTRRWQRWLIDNSYVDDRFRVAGFMHRSCGEPTLIDDPDVAAGIDPVGACSGCRFEITVPAGELIPLYWRHP